MHELASEDRVFWDNVKATFLFSDDDVAQLTPQQLKCLKKGEELDRYKIVAEVINAEHCALLRVGDRYVFEPGGRIITEESAPLCLWALAAMLPFNFMVFDRIVEGIDPNGINLRHIRCSDTTLPFGGIGQAVFRFTVARKDRT